MHPCAPPNANAAGCHAAPLVSLTQQSLHDPLLVLNVESEVPGGAVSTAARVVAFLRSEPLAGLPLQLGELADLKA